MPSGSRRRFLRLAGALGGLSSLVAAAGCAGSDDDRETVPTDRTSGDGTPTDGATGTIDPPDDGPSEVATDLPALSGDWRSYRHDARNTAAGEAPGPVDPPTAVWRRATATGPPATDPAAAGKAVVFVAETGFPMALAPDDGTIRWQAARPASTEVDPAASEGTVVVADGDALVGVVAESGTERWRAPAGGTVSGVAAGAGLAVATTEGGLAAVSLDDGTGAWRADASGTVGAPAVGEGVVAAGLSTGAVRAFDAGSGRERWTGSVGSDPDPAFRPAVADGRVYHAVGSDLAAFDATTGERAWSESGFPFVASPVATGEAVYACSLEAEADVERTGSPSPTPRPTDAIPYRAYVQALAPADGAERWQATATGTYYFTVGAESGAPESLPLGVGGNRVVLDAGRLVAFDAATGERAWSGGPGNGRTPVAVDGVVSTGSVGVALADGSVRWRFDVETGFTSPPAVVGNTVYAGNEDTHLYAMAADSGVVEWRARTNGRVRSAPAVGEAAVYVGSRNDYLYAFDREDGTELWNAYLGGPVKASPTLADGTVYVGNFGELLAVDAADGSERWRVNPGDRFVAGTPAVADGAVFAGANGELRAFDAATGADRWRTRFAEEPLVQSPPAAAGGLVFLNAGDALRAVDPADGTERWSHATGGSNRPPAVRDGTVYAPGDDAVYAVDAADGTERWRTPVGGEVELAVGDAVYALGYRGPPVGLDPDDGTVRWRGTGTTEGGIRGAGAPAVAGEYLFVGDTRGRMHALGPDPG